MEASELFFPEVSKAAGCEAFYRTRLGIKPRPRIPSRRKPKTTRDILDAGTNVDFVTLTVKGKALSYSILGNHRVSTHLRAAPLSQGRALLPTTECGKCFQSGGISRRGPFPIVAVVAEPIGGASFGNSETPS